LSERDPALRDDLRRLIEPVTLGDPVRPLLWGLSALLGHRYPTSRTKHERVDYWQSAIPLMAEAPDELGGRQQGASVMVL
jgi:hypothetical protein